MSRPRDYRDTDGRRGTRALRARSRGVDLYILRCAAPRVSFVAKRAAGTRRRERCALACGVRRPAQGTTTATGSEGERRRQDELGSATRPLAGRRSIYTLSCSAGYELRGQDIGGKTTKARALRARSRDLDPYICCRPAGVASVRATTKGMMAKAAGMRERYALARGNSMHISFVVRRGGRRPGGARA